MKIDCFCGLGAYPNFCMKNPVTLTLRSLLCGLTAICAISVSHADETQGAKESKTPPGLVKKYDVNKDGVLDEQEKAALEADKAKKTAAMEAKRLKRFDANKDGTLDESELAAESAAKQAEAEKRKAAIDKKKAEKEAAAQPPAQ
jgi:hypothetical protein